MALKLDTAEQGGEYAYAMLKAYADGLAGDSLQVYNGINQAQAEAMHRLGAANKEDNNGQGKEGYDNNEYFITKFALNIKLTNNKVAFVT